ncbi:MAG: hypothetical protein GKR91_05880 [Pseudomonadales bacterium]|nr:hypothetical protein [Pseudomonadales bacterium]
MKDGSSSAARIRSGFPRSGLSRLRRLLPAVGAALLLLMRNRPSPALGMWEELLNSGEGRGESAAPAPTVV